MKKIIRMIVGGLGGVLVYCSFVMLKELRHFVFRGYYDWEGVIYECMLPIGVFTLFSKAAWQNLPLWVNLETALGAVLASIGIAIGGRKNSSRKARTLVD